MDSNIQWLATAATAFPMQILIGVVATIPFTVTIFLGGLSSIPDDLYEAAPTAGAPARAPRAVRIAGPAGPPPPRRGPGQELPRRPRVDTGRPLRGRRHRGRARLGSV